MPFFKATQTLANFIRRLEFGAMHPQKIAECGDILISVRAPIGALNIANEQCCIGRGLAALTANEALCDLKYLWYLA